MQFVKLKNGNIILLTRTVHVHEVGHGININSPQLKQVNFRLQRINGGWKTCYEEIGKVLKENYFGGSCTCHTHDTSHARWKKIFYMLAEMH